MPHFERFDLKAGRDNLPQNLTFCSHAALGRDFFEVPDASADARFADHPLVADTPLVPTTRPCLAANTGNGRQARDTDSAQEAREFVYVVCHDFRAPLVNVLGFADELALQDACAVVDIAPLATLRADATVLHHIFQNLIDNAVKYRSEERPLHIAVSLDLNEQGIVVHVRDNGRGIVSTDQTRIFDMFVRSGAKGARGEGIGLYHARTLVAKLGGRIWCDSALGDGTTFHVALPLKPIRPPVPSGGETRARACSG